MTRFFPPRLVAALLLLSTLSPVSARAADSSPAPVPTKDSASKIKLPEGFTATLFAGEPDVVQPIAFTWDERGRMWVVECRSYPHWATDDKPGVDSIIILEDTDGDGKFDKKTVFADKLRNVSAIEVGFGGVWIGAVPHLQFIPDKNRDDKPDGPPEVLLDGWNLKEVKHNIFSSFTWGPDGWLYATNGIQSKSKVGKPGTPDDQRVKFDCGVWRYHPTRHVFEVVAVGTTNPWGLDFDEYGQCFITNCVIDHLWHVIPGAHYERMYGQHFNPYHYGVMKTCADHRHWAHGTNWTDSRSGEGKHSEAGGGHAHIGAMIYQGDNWPAEYRGSIFTCNLHGGRVNRDILKQKGSGYVASHGKDFAFWNDPWFRGLAIKQGPDGAVYVSDWSDTGECHNYDKADFSNGRIYRIAYGKPKAIGVLSEEELVKSIYHENAWHSRTARRLLQERAAAGKIDPKTVEGLAAGVRQSPDTKIRLQELWALAAAGGLTAEPSLLQELMMDGKEYVCGWAIRLAVDAGRPSDDELKMFSRLAKESRSPVVRLHLASALQRLPIADRWPIAEALVQHADDNADKNIPLMVWFGVEPLAAADPARALKMAETSKLNIVNQYIARRVCDGQNKDGLASVTALLGKTDDAELQKWLLVGVSEALAGLRKVEQPAGWNDVYQKLIQSKRGEVRDGVTQVALIFGDTVALNDLRKRAADPAADAQARNRAVQSLVGAKDPELASLLHKLVDDRDVRVSAIRGMAAIGHADSGKLLASKYDAVSAAEKAEIIQALVSRPAYALELLSAVQANAIPRADLTPLTIRQIAGLKDKAVAARLTEVWGVVRPPEKDKQQRISQLKKQLTADVVARADLSNGRAIYTKTCAQCHTMFGEGGKVGPDLTGSQRANLDYVLENSVDPSGQVANEYKVTIIDTKDGRTLEGIVVKETDTGVTLRTATEEVLVTKTDIEKRRQSNMSMMPEGLIDALSPNDLRDLVGYLASPNQVK